MTTKTKSTNAVNPSNSTVVRGFISVGNRDTDLSDVDFTWGTLITANPRNEAGEAVSNPGSFYIYQAKELKPGDFTEVVLMKRGLGGLYNHIPESKVESVLKALGLKREELPEIPVVESRSAQLDRQEASDRASTFRKNKSKLKMLQMESQMNALLDSEDTTVDLSTEMSEATTI